MTVVNNNKVELLLIIVIGILAVLLRFAYPAVVTTGTDETEFFARAQQMLETKQPILDGKSHETNQFFGPFMFYLSALPQIITPSYLGISVLYGMLSLAVVIIAFFFTKKHFGKKVALITTALLATSPWYNIYSRIPYNVAPISLFAILFMLSVFSLYFNKDKHLPLLGMSLSMSIMLQIHLSAAAFAPILVVALIQNRKDVSTKTIGIAVLLAALLFSPFIYYNLTNNFQGIREVLSLPQQNPSEGFVINTVEAIGIPAMLTSNYLGAYFTGTTNPLKSGLRWVALVVSGITIVLFGLAVLYAMNQIRKKEIKREIKIKYALLLAWLIVPVILLILRNRNISPHYYYVLFPVQFILLGILFEHGYGILKKLQYKKEWIVTMLIAIIVIMNTLQYGSFLYIVNQSGGTDGSFGATYANKVAVVDALSTNVQDSQSKWIFYKKEDSGYSLIAKEKGITPTIEMINTPDEITKKEGYLIFDTYTRYGIRWIGGITEEELAFFKQLELRNDVKKIGTVNVLWLTPAEKDAGTETFK